MAGLIFVSASLLLLISCSAEKTALNIPLDTAISHQQRPNILLIVADDLGYAELGAYGSEINTPAIDSLAETGIRYTNFYAHSNCSPSRAMLLSGVDSHLAGLGAMHGYEGPNQKGQPGYEGYLNQRTVSFAKLLQDSGYQTFMAGKWHLGNTPQTLPAARGFSRYFIQAGGAPPGGHFNLNGPRAGAKSAYFEDGIDRTGAEVASDFFSSNFYATKLIEYLGSRQESGSPFFAYLAFSAPHIPVQAPDSHINLYQGKYDVGYDLTRKRRLENMQRLGLVDKELAPSRRSPTVTPWELLTKDQQRVQSRRMEVYAGAIENLDDNVGRVLNFLRGSGEYENTLILFMSDNGAAGFNGWQSDALLNKFQAADNSLENLGRDGSMMFYGPGWASAGSAPFYLFKRHMAEGGIRVPLIATGPGVEHRGSISHQPVTVRDLAPTLLELAGTHYPSESYYGRKILPQSGASLVAQLAGKKAEIHHSSEVFGWELFKRRGLRKGEWKAIWLESPFGKDQWQLYNLSTDPGETKDLADKEPEKMAEMVAAWNTYARNNNVIISDAPLAFP